MSQGTFGDGIDWDFEATSQMAANPDSFEGSQLVERLAKAIGYEPGMGPVPYVVDLGCSIGRFSPMFTKRGWQYLGLDQSEVALKIATTRDEKATFFRMWLDQLPWEDVFDIGLFNAVLQHNDYPAQQRIVAAAFRALKPGGVLFAAESTVRTATRTQRTPLGWIHLFESAGFEVIETWHPNPEYRLNDHYLLRKPGPSLIAVPPSPPVETSTEPVEVRIKATSELTVGATLYGRSAIKGTAGRSCVIASVPDAKKVLVQHPTGRSGTLALSTLKKSWCLHA